MQIHGPTHVHGPQPLNAPHRTQAAQPNQASSQPGQVDQVDISPEADFVSRVRELPEVRQELVNQIRSEIQAGTYETPEKLEMALGALLDDLDH